MASDILSLIQSEMGKFSKGQKLIANYILNNYDKAAFMTASRLGQTANVSESTVVRFAVEIGFDGYPDMQKALQEMIRNKLTSVQRLEVTNDRIASRDILSMVLQSDINSIRNTIENVVRSDFEKAVEEILKARHIYILGVRSAAATASFLGFYFNLIFDNVTLVNTASVSEIFEQIFRIKENDVIIGISFPRYSSRTVKSLKFAKDRGAEVIAITDSMSSPIAQHASIPLLAKSEMVSFVDSLVAPMSLINALIVAVVREKQNEVSETFTGLERIWDEYEVYEKTKS